MMTNEKARDFFSAYFEGTLEHGLSLSFEQKLRADSQLHQEYRAFAETMTSLDVLKLEEIVPPPDLHERISARLDRHIYDQKRRAKNTWIGWVRGFALAGVAAAAVLGAIVTLNNRGSGPVVASTVGAPIPDVVTYTASDEGVRLSFAPRSQKTIRVTDASGTELRRESATATKPFEGRLDNGNESAAVFMIEVLGDSEKSYVALPGSTRSASGSGEGDLVAFAKAVAEYYRVTVHVRPESASRTLTWNFASGDPVEEVSKVLEGSYRVTLLKNGMLQIEK